MYNDLGVPPQNLDELELLWTEKRTLLADISLQLKSNIEEDFPAKQDFISWQKRTRNKKRLLISQEAILRTHITRIKTELKAERLAQEDKIRLQLSENKMSPDLEIRVSFLEEENLKLRSCIKELRFQITKIKERIDHLEES